MTGVQTCALPISTVNDPGDKNGGLNIPIGAFNGLTATTTGAQNVAIGALRWAIR